MHCRVYHSDFQFINVSTRVNGIFFKSLNFKEEPTSKMTLKTSLQSQVTNGAQIESPFPPKMARFTKWRKDPLLSIKDSL